MPIRAIIFDIGGVLVRAADLSSRRRWEEQLGMPQGGLGELVFGSDIEQRALIGAATEDEVWVEIGGQLGIAPGECAQFGRDFWGAWAVDAGLISLIRGLRPRYKTAVLSNAWPGIRDIHTHETGLNNEVDLMIFSCEAGVAKPDPRIFELAAEQLGVRPEEAIFVDDVLENVQAAQSAGMHGIQFIDTHQVIGDVRSELASE